MKVFAIGFTKKNAQRFFELPRGSGAKRVVDVRLNNVSQLAGFAKEDDLAFFLKEICGMEYVRLPALAPTQEMLDEYKKQRGERRKAGGSLIEPTSTGTLKPWRESLHIFRAWSGRT